MSFPFRRRQSPRAPVPPPDERLGQVLAEVRHIEVQTSRLVTDVVAGGYRSSFRGVGVEFSDVREYVEGDDPRSVDWNVTARAGRPFVKRFVEERERTLLFVLDLSPSLGYGLGAWSLRQVAARFAALLGFAAIQNHDRMGLVAGSAEGVRFVPPRPSGAHVLRVVRDCLTMPLGRAADLPALLATTSARLRRRAVVFVVSDFAAPGYEHALTLCARRHDVVTVRLVPREVLEPPRALWRIVDPLSGRHRRLDLIDETARQAFVDGLAVRRAAHDELLRRLHLDGFDIVTPELADPVALAAPLLRFFRRRALREVRR